MSRLHLFELEDMPWLPASIRDGITDFLQFAVVKADLYRRIAPRLAQAIKASGHNRILDLCSGGGGAWPVLLDRIEPLVGTELAVCLTDLYPNHAAFSALQHQTSGRIGCYNAMVDAAAVPPQLHGFRTLFSSFHHFRPQQARAILNDAVRQGQPVAILESTQRHPLLLLYMLITPLIVMLSTPFIRPFRWSRLFWTYILPAIPLAVMFDGLVSCLRTYDEDELEGLVLSLDDNTYQWNMGVERHGRLPVGVTYLIGLPG